MPSTTASKLERQVGALHVPDEGPLSPAQAVAALRRALEDDEPWFRALLRVIGRWVAPVEEIDGAVHRYLVGGEAFDWLLLAQRLLTEVRDLVPAEDVEALLVFGIAPDDVDEEEFEQLIGAQKYLAHLNFQYGVVVEELLLLSVELELQKAGRLAGSGAPPPDVQAFEHVYGKSFDELQVLYRTDNDAVLPERMSQNEYQEFIYWCSKFRVRSVEPARVASDTRKAMALMSRMEATRRRLGRIRGDRRVTLSVRR